MDKNKLATAITQALEKGKGKAKFSQSIEVAINFRDVDFNKPENRLNLDIVLPYAPKVPKIAVFADGQLALDARGVCDKVISGAEIENYAKDKKLQKELLNYTLLASTQLMPLIGKTLGQLLGARGKLPKPVMPNMNLKDLVNRTQRSVSIKTKGKYLPTVHVIIGKDTMPVEQILENLQTVLEAIGKKLPEHQISSIYLKTTMGPALKVAN
ncbi:MAG: 50S ribosomal protein L1 [Candidatus Micrarchaeota archaeon]